MRVGGCQFPLLKTVLIQSVVAVDLTLSLDTHQIERSVFGTPWVICPLL